MLAVSFKANRKTLTTAVVLLLTLLCSAVLIGTLFSGATKPAADTQQGSALPAIGTKAETPAEIRAFLTAFGWETPAQPEETIQVLIPVQFDEVMEQYNAIQLAQGGDLTRYRGKTVQRCTFRVTNHPEGEEVRANVLVYRGRIIGGDVCSLELNGFMHGFSR